MGNDGHSTQNLFYPRQAGQDQKYFAPGTSKAKPAAALTDDQKLEIGLTKMLGSAEAAREYVRCLQRSRGTGTRYVQDPMAHAVANFLLSRRPK